MTQTESARDWDGWEIWYFGADYVSTAEVPPGHWRVSPEPPPEPHLWVVAGGSGEAAAHATTAWPWSMENAASQAWAA